MWWSWPTCYDCWWIVTEAFKQVGYWWPKMNSKRLSEECFQKPIQYAQKWDLLVDTLPPTHVAYITSVYDSRNVIILDYVDKFTKATYRKHWIIEWTIICDWHPYLRK